MKLTKSPYFDVLLILAAFGVFFVLGFVHGQVSVKKDICDPVDANCDGVKDLVDVSIHAYRMNQIAHDTQASNDIYLPDKNYYVRKILWVSETKKVREELDAHFEEEGILPIGLASMTSDECIIYALEPKRGEEIKNSDLIILGHEFLHCMRGSWHKNYD